MTKGVSRSAVPRSAAEGELAKQVAILARNAAHLLPADGLEEKLKLGRPLRVKLGIDATAPHVTLGNGIPLQRMRAFQEAGHIGVLIVGDYTTRIGDPTGRSQTRPILLPEEIEENAKQFFEQACTIIDRDRTEMHFNSEWLAKLDFAEVLRLARTTTVARLLERDDFAKRYATSQPISVSELLYPLVQAFDSVAVRADVELGGTDQLYNLLTGRDVMMVYGLEPQVALTVEYLESWDGEGMSASRGNFIGLGEPPEEQFGKAMRIPDDLLAQWYRLVLESDADPLAIGPLEAKLALARFIVSRSHGEAEAEAAEAHFTRVVRKRQVPKEMRTLKLPDGDPVHLPTLITTADFASSTSEARRLIASGAVWLDGERVDAVDVSRARLAGATLQVGKRRFARLAS
jgi:tyrosyl-tRNA synthetase